MADETSIKVSATTRDRLALLAAENNTTIRNLVEALAESRPTQSEFDAELDLSQYTSVSIWCDRFNVSFGAAALAKA